MANVADAELALGVPSGQVRLVTHLPAWAALFDVERRRIVSALGTLAADVQHVGSTSVPGLLAKPILDIAIAVATPHASAQAVARLAVIGYHDLGWRSAQVGHLLEKLGPGGRTHCIHLLPRASPHFHDYLLVRDHLRSNLAARAEYQVVKRTLALAHPQDRRAYTAAKGAEVARLIAQARARSAILAAAGLPFPIGGAPLHAVRHRAFSSFLLSSPTGPSSP
ncbi:MULTISPECIES: GrpB family protein [unclassified Variovorax]|uniref:GrpB family protein n=1 Tax=unclassified Variovorax TaxID=663243 RepID=UPI002576097F|nr:MULTISPECIES: GrpB family protein [unclassified Variovorax]MDM0087208.1 GrpB family protein [Variovorax sp. J22G40]MDM0144535.1 GrpB family protein [Variovorax sp. J2P1-31]